MALAARYRAGDDTTGLVHHSDRGVQGLTHLVKALADWSIEHWDGIADARQAYDAQHPENEIR